MSTELQPVIPPDPLSLVAQAIERGADVEKLHAFLDLHERLLRLQAEKAYNEAMNACQAEMPAVVKDKQNSFLGNMYAALDTVQRAAKPVYTRHGFSLSWGEEPCDTEGMRWVVCEVMHVGGHRKTFRGMYPIDGEGAKGGKMMNKLQGVVSSNSYAQRDLMRLVFNLTIADTDHDGNRTVGEAQVKEIEKLLAEAQERPERILKWLGIESLDQIPAERFEDAVRWLRKTIQAKKGAKS